MMACRLRAEVSLSPRPEAEQPSTLSGSVHSVAASTLPPPPPQPSAQAAPQPRPQPHSAPAQPRPQAYSGRVLDQPPPGIGPPLHGAPAAAGYAQPPPPQRAGTVPAAMPSPANGACLLPQCALYSCHCKTFHSSHISLHL